MRVRLWPLDPKEMQQRMTDEQKKMQAEMLRQMQKRTEQGFLPGAPPGVFIPGAAGDPTSQMLFQMKQLLQQNDMVGGSGAFLASSGDHDPIEIGQQMVIAGLEVQLKGLASTINATKDKEAKQKLTAEFHEVVEGRKKQRERTVKQLEKRLAELKKQADNDESADAMVKRLLEPEQFDKKLDAKPVE